MHLTVAALYVDAKKGPYPAMEGVEVWDSDRDATAYEGPFPVVAHPPCGHWGALAWNCKQPQSWKDCGPRAVQQVRAYGGVLEHPANSRLWKECGIPRPGEFSFDSAGGWSIEVRQVEWGHKAQKRTWLYFVGIEPIPILRPFPGRESTHVMGVPLHKGRTKPCLPKSERHLTPPLFAAWLVECARSVNAHR